MVDTDLVATVGKLVFVGRNAVAVGIGLEVEEVDTMLRVVEDREGEDVEELEDDRLGVLLCNPDPVG